MSEPIAVEFLGFSINSLLNEIGKKISLTPGSPERQASRISVQVQRFNDILLHTLPAAAYETSCLLS